MSRKLHRAESKMKNMESNAKSKLQTLDESDPNYYWFLSQLCMIDILRAEFRAQRRIDKKQLAGKESK